VVLSAGTTFETFLYSFPAILTLVILAESICFPD
jgi:hypothetical protein